MKKNKKIFIGIASIILVASLGMNIYSINMIGKMSDKIEKNEETLEFIKEYTGYKSEEESIKEYEESNEKVIEFFAKEEDNLHLVTEDVSSKEALFNISDKNEYYVLFYAVGNQFSNDAILATESLVASGNDVYYINLYEMPVNDYFGEFLNQDSYTKDSFSFSEFPLLIKVSGNDITAITGSVNISEELK